MSNTLLLFIQTPNNDVYVNAITHCFHHENVKDVLFVGRQVAPTETYKTFDIIRNIRTNMQQYGDDFSKDYKDALVIVPDSAETRKKKTLFIEFSSPDKLLTEIENQGLSRTELIIDISGCQKRLASDILTSFLSKGFERVCYFELADIVYDSEWKPHLKPFEKKRYHEVRNSDYIYYEYDDLGRTGLSSIRMNQLRGQGRIIRILLVVCLILGIVATIASSQEQTTASLASTAIIAIATTLGLLEDFFNFIERFRR